MPCLTPCRTMFGTRQPSPMYTLVAHNVAWVLIYLPYLVRMCCSSRTWSAIFPPLDSLQFSNAHKLFETLCCSNTLSEAKKELHLYVTWSLWEARCNFIFKQHKRNRDLIVACASFMPLGFQSNPTHPGHSSARPPLSWSPLPFAAPLCGHNNKMERFHLGGNWERQGGVYTLHLELQLCRPTASRSSGCS